VTGDQFYGAKASLNVWPAKVASAAEFSLSQIWVISGSFGNDLNTIEAGWQVRTLRYALAVTKTALLSAAVRTCMYSPSLKQPPSFLPSTYRDAP
jgi:hypothetical protein